MGHPTKPRPIEERFWEKVDAAGDCWEWTACRNEHGYGSFVTERPKKVKAHRMAWELLVGPIPDGMVLDHLCRNPRCVNPDHLEVVTQRINMLRGYGIARRAANATHCPQGHPYNAENTAYTKKGHRACRACILARSRKTHDYQGNVKNAPKTQCKYGHPFDAANTRINPKGHQVCRTCHRENVKAANQRKRGDLVNERLEGAA